MSRVLNAALSFRRARMNTSGPYGWRGREGAACRAISEVHTGTTSRCIARRPPLVQDFLAINHPLDAAV